MPMMPRTRRSILILVLLFAPLAASADWSRVRAMVREADATSDDEQKERLLRQAYAEAQTSTRKAPTVSNEYLWLANAAGRLAQAVSIKEMIVLSKVVKVNAEKAIELDTRNG